jgi:ureidoacrylate peracid hydrolase
MPTLEQLIDPKRAALVIIDVQNDFCHSNYPSYLEMLATLQHLVATARAAGVRLVYTRHVNSDKTDSAVWLSRHGKRPHQKGICRAGSTGIEVHASVAPRPEDTVIDKYRYNAFLGTPLEVALRAQGIDALLFTGIATNCCVENSAREAFQRDFWTVMVADCMVAHSDEAHRAALSNCERGFGIVARAEDITAAWAR